MKSTRLLIADRFPLTLRGLRDLLLAQGGRWEICATVGCGQEALDRAGELRPQAVIVDDQLEDISALALAAELRRRLRRVEILIYCGSTALPWVYQFDRSRVTGCVLKSEPPEDLLHVLEAVSAHHWVRSRGVIRLSERYQAMERRGTGEPLSERELEVAQLLARGHSTKETAGELGLSPDTIESHRGRIYRKLGLRSVVALTHWAIACGLVGDR